MTTRTSYARSRARSCHQRRTPAVALRPRRTQVRSCCRAKRQTHVSSNSRQRRKLHPDTNSAAASENWEPSGRELWVRAPAVQKRPVRIMRKPKNTARNSEQVSIVPWRTSATAASSHDSPSAARRVYPTRPRRSPQQLQSELHLSGCRRRARDYARRRRNARRSEHNWIRCIEIRAVQ